jgi:cytochrome c peroxidase
MRFTLFAAIAVALLAACSEPDETQLLKDDLQALATENEARVQELPPVDINPRLLRRFSPLRGQLETPDNPITTAKVELGRMLFFETRLSKNHDLSCNSCHALDHYGVDNQSTSSGHRKQRGARNAPTVYNAAGFFAQFWDGRMNTIEEQALGPILNPIEMALPSAQQGVRVLKSIPEYRAAFASAFPGEAEPVTFDNLGRAIGAFERRLTTPSRWDDYLRGKPSALSANELEGLKIFTNIGCMVCHTGEFVGGAMYQKVGIVEEWPNQKDQGRYEVTKQDVDRMVFKVPTLRNVAKTGPYFHDGSVPELDAAVRRMAKHQLGLSLSEREVSAIVAWLNSLTGQLPEQYIKAPTLPPSSAETPAPDPT